MKVLSVFVIYLGVLASVTQANAAPGWFTRFQGACRAAFAQPDHPARTDAAYTETLWNLLRNSRDLQEMIIYRYLLVESKITWDWQIEAGYVRMNFSPNRSEHNELLLTSGSMALLLAEGQLALYRDDPRQPTFIPAFALEPSAPRPSYRAALEARANPALEALRDTPQTSALVDLATMQVTESPVNEPTVHIYANATEMITHGDRFWGLMATPEFKWLEIRWSPDRLRTLQGRLRQITRQYRPR